VGDDQITTARVDEVVDAAAADPRSEQLFQGRRGEARRSAVSVLVQTDLFRAIARHGNLTVDRVLIDSAVRSDQVAAEALRLGVSPMAYGTLVAYVTAVQRSVLDEVAPGGSTRLLSPDESAEASRRYNQLRAEVLRANPVTLNPQYGRFDLAAQQVVPVLEPGVVLVSGGEGGHP
jgi:hypothetical protein